MRHQHFISVCHSGGTDKRVWRLTQNTARKTRVKWSEYFSSLPSRQSRLFRALSRRQGRLCKFKPSSSHSLPVLFAAWKFQSLLFTILSWDNSFSSRRALSTWNYFISSFSSSVCTTLKLLSNSLSSLEWLFSTVDSIPCRRLPVTHKSGRETMTKF